MFVNITRVIKVLNFLGIDYKVRTVVKTRINIKRIYTYFKQCNNVNVDFSLYGEVKTKTRNKKHSIVCLCIDINGGDKFYDFISVMYTPRPTR